MTFKEMLSKLGQKSKDRKAKFKEMDEEIRMQEMIEERKLSANERELNRFMKEEREEQVKEALDYYRKKKDEDIKFGHNPLDTENITKSEWEILKEKNQFKGKSNMFTNHQSALKSNKNLLKNNKRICSI